MDQGNASHSVVPTTLPNPVDVGESYDPSYCSVKLPAPHPLAPIDSPVAERLFIVCTPIPPPLYALLIERILNKRKSNVKWKLYRFKGNFDIYI